MAMMTRRCLFYLALALLNHFSHSIQDNETCANSEVCPESIKKDKHRGNQHSPSLDESQEPPQCSMYIAPSTIVNAGLGVFTSIPLTKHDNVPNVSDVIVPLIDVSYYQEDADYFFNPFDDYSWASMCFGMHHKAQSPASTLAFSPGLLSLMNSHPTMMSNTRHGKFKYDTYVGGHRDTSPSARSMTPYFDSETIVTQNVKAGGELFINYGSD